MRQCMGGYKSGTSLIWFDASKSLLLKMVGNEHKVELIENEERQEYDISFKGRSFSLLRATWSDSRLAIFTLMEIVVVMEGNNMTFRRMLPSISI